MARNRAQGALRWQVTAPNTRGALQQMDSLANKIQGINKRTAFKVRTSVLEQLESTRVRRATPDTRVGRPGKNMRLRSALMAPTMTRYNNTGFGYGNERFLDNNVAYWRQIEKGYEGHMNRVQRAWFVDGSGTRFDPDPDKGPIHAWRPGGPTSPKVTIRTPIRAHWFMRAGWNSLVYGPYQDQVVKALDAILK